MIKKELCSGRILINHYLNRDFKKFKYENYKIINKGYYLEDKYIYKYKDNSKKDILLKNRVFLSIKI